MKSTASMGAVRRDIGGLATGVQQLQRLSLKPLHKENQLGENRCVPRRGGLWEEQGQAVENAEGRQPCWGASGNAGIVLPVLVIISWGSILSCDRLRFGDRASSSFHTGHL
ncbi:hypothetical protein AAFF_G00213570 [Aldrovandia affinis]|uniref:Uncharacterized protein n=1 Tax=Aldrovandia affinis TaxID=143900 RepID=A0AAD7W5S2_9TELE|nr:hypothetical protein AAFF_G00213570 [Aldrovandia affinis]